MRAQLARTFRAIAKLDRSNSAAAPSIETSRRGNGAARAAIEQACMEPLEGRRLLSTYYVSPSGSDSASGSSESSAWKSVSRVNSQKLNDGDKVLFKGGSSFSGALTLSSTESSSASNPVTFSTYGSGRATINSGSKSGIDIGQAGGVSISNLNFRGNGMNSNSVCGIYVHADGGRTISGFNFKNIDVSGYGREGIRFNAAVGSQVNDVNVSYSSSHDNLWGGLKANTSRISGMKNYKIDHVTAYNNVGSRSTDNVTGNGIFLEGISGGTITRCVAYNNGKDGNRPVGIWCAMGDRYTIQYCESYDNKTASGSDGGGFDFDWDVSNSTMQYNYSHNNHGPGYILAAGTHTLRNCTVRYNVSQNDGRKNGRAGLQIWGDVRDSSIYNNVVYITYAGSSNSAAFYAHDLGSANGRTPQNMAVRNNIFYTTGGVKLINVTSGVATKGTIKFSGNAYHSGGSTFKIQWGSSSYSSLSSWSSGKGQEKTNGVATGYQGDPKLNAVGQGGTIGNADNLGNLTAYKLQSTSPLVNRGVAQPGTLSAATKDFYGDSTPKGGKYDIGVDEVA